MHLAAEITRFLSRKMNGYAVLSILGNTFQIFCCWKAEVGFFFSLIIPPVGCMFVYA